MNFVDVALDLPVDGFFTYSVPEGLEAATLAGRRVLVPLGRRLVTGFVVGAREKAPVENVREIKEVIDSTPLFDERRKKFYRWLSSYYLCPPGKVFSLVQPPGTGPKGERFFVAIKKSKIENPEDFDGEVFRYISRRKNGAALSVLSARFRGQSLGAVLERLKKGGLVTEEMRTKSPARKVERFLAPVDPGRIWSGPEVQEKVYNFIRERGGVSAAEVRKALGSIDSAVRRLAEKGLIEINERSVERNPVEGIPPRQSDHSPTPDQTRAIKEITSALGKGAFSPFLLYGVTGSGKTLVYLKVLEEVMRRGGSALFLVPEIALTPWPAAYLKQRFPGQVALFHSGLSEGERLDEWTRVVEGRARILTGTRSALFVPIRDLSIIIVDEEHDPSYKEEKGVRYSGRDSALMLGKYLEIPVVLGSATPSVETFYNARRGKITPVHLPVRVGGRSMPTVEIVDMRGAGETVISERLSSLMAGTLERGEQTLLFLNRRGFSGCLVCRDCGHSFTCPNCSVTLTVHKKVARLRCHYCDHSTAIPGVCPGCRGSNLVDPGTGTERVEDEIKKLFPGARVVRLDRDTASRKGAARAVIEAMEKGKADVLVGTQMVTKGHHFPSVTLVGVVSGDTSLSIPDFRSPERTFQLLVQAAGRAGRGTRSGRVVIQTLNPGHYSFRSIKGHDYEAFFEEEIALREELGYPPFTRLCVIRFEGRVENDVISAADFLKRAADNAVGRGGGVAVLGPAPALVQKVRGRHRFHLLLKGSNTKALRPLVLSLKNLTDCKGRKGVKVTFDMDPVTIV